MSLRVVSFSVCLVYLAFILLRTSIKIIQWNCRSLINTLPWLRHPPFSTADVLVFQESFLSPDKSAAIPGKIVYRSNRLGHPSDRLVIVLNNSWSSARISFPGSTFTNEIMDVHCFQAPF